MIYRLALTLILLACWPVSQAFAQGDPCDPNPCTSPPPDECDPDGVTLIEYAPTGLCLDLGDGTFECTYTSSLTDCSALGKICQGAACVSAVGGTIPALPREAVPLLVGLIVGTAGWFAWRRRSAG
jgi:hypothetical protein